VTNPTTTVAELGEQAIIERITRRLEMPAWVEVGPGDDAAVVKPPRGRREVLTTDALVDGVHFDQAFVPPGAIGHRALAVNLSDLAAMGAEPRAALLSLALPGGFAVASLDALVDGFLRHASAHRTTLLGGNVTQTPGPLVINVTAIGAVRPHGALTRAGARPGDEIYLTGAVGDAAAGLAMLRASAAEATAESACAGRYLRPEPRVRAGLQLAHHGAASSCVDLSDGLADGLRQLARASGVGVEVEAGALPISDEARAWHAAAGTDPLAAALGGGDDYELLFTVPPSEQQRLEARAAGLDVVVTRIGRVEEGAGASLSDGGALRDIGGFGHDHFEMAR
jgi:thiamine-monophosphate kinase